MNIKLLLFIGAWHMSASLSACPTCVGKLRPESPLFFSDEFYKPTQSHGISRETKEEVGRHELKKLIESKRGKK